MQDGQFLSKKYITDHEYINAEAFRMGEQDIQSFSKLASLSFHDRLHDHVSMFMRIYDYYEWSFPEQN